MGIFVKNNEKYKKINGPQQFVTSQLTYGAGQLVPQGSYCTSIPISTTVELSLLHHLAQLHCQSYSTGDKKN